MHLTAFGTCGTTRSAEDQAQEESAVVFPEFGNQLKLNSYPNPMSNEAIIEFTSEQDIHGALELYSSTGELVSTIFNGNLKGGETQVVRFNATELSSGIYICKLSAGDTVQYNRIIISK
jgi:hypothetical protein